MAKKVHKRPTPGGRAAGKAGQRAQEPARLPPTRGGSTPLASGGNGVPAPVPHDTMGETTTYVYDGQHCLTSVGDFGPPPSPLAPDRQMLRTPKRRFSRKRAKAKTPKKR
jgi:hypothetical protein